MASGTIDIAQMLVNLEGSLNPVSQLVTGSAYLIGIILVFKAFYHLKVYGEARTMMSSQTSIKTPVTYMIVGAVFLWLPTAFYSILATGYGGGARILSYDEWVGASNLTRQGRVVMGAIFRLVQIIGLIAFIRGWMYISKGADKGAQAQTGKALTHIVGGILGMNIVWTANVLQATVGVDLFS